MLYATLFVIVLILLIIAYAIYKKRNNAISFEDSFYKTGMPVISLYNDAYKLNFLVDTGSDACYINQRTLKYLHYTESSKKSINISSNGAQELKSIFLPLDFGNSIIRVHMYTIDLSASFDEIKEHDGIEIHGILGSEFCREAKFVVDFNKLTIR